MGLDSAKFMYRYNVIMAIFNLTNLFTQIKYNKN